MVLALAFVVAGLACYRLPPPRNGPAGGASERGEETGRATRPEPPPVSEAQRAEAERLQALGPVYTPYDQGPRLLWDEAAQRAVVETLAPVIEARGLPVTTRGLVWVLVGAGGRVVDAVVQTSSSSEPFDGAALELASRLRFDPARAEDGGRVPVWVIREISLLMQ